MALRRRAAGGPAARVARRNTAKGETFVHEVTPQMFELFEGLYEAPAPAELEGALVSVTD